MRSLWIAATLACLALAGCSSEPLDVAPSVDLARFQGQWFEIAKLPRYTQAKCTGTTAYYVLREGGLDVTHQCRLLRLDGLVKSSFARVNPTGEGVASKLSLDVSGFGYDYWILEVGEQYEYAVIGVPSRDYLWILSRTPSLDQAKIDAILARMRASKFDTTRLEYTPQDLHVTVDPHHPPTPIGGAEVPALYGCAWSGRPAPAPADKLPLGAAAAALVALAASRRRQQRRP